MSIDEQNKILLDSSNWINANSIYKFEVDNLSYKKKYEMTLCNESTTCTTNNSTTLKFINTNNNLCSRCYIF